jgi:hypothetical protein
MEVGTSVSEEHTASIIRIDVLKFGKVVGYTEVKGGKKWVMEYGNGQLESRMGRKWKTGIECARGKLNP